MRIAEDNHMKMIFSVLVCVLAASLSHCTKKLGSQAMGGVYSCSVKKGETHQTCTEFKNLNASEIAYFKQKCDSDSSMDAASWQEFACSTDAKQGGCELQFSDSASSITTSFVAWGYTATALAAITAPDACENSGGRIVQP
jgi:hypothetical protein